MTSQTPEDPSSEPSPDFSSAAPASWSQPVPDPSTGEIGESGPEPTPFGQPSPPGQPAPFGPPAPADPGGWSTAGQSPSGHVPPSNYPPGPYPPGPYPPGPYPPGPYPPEQYPPNSYPPGQFGYHPQFFAPPTARNNPFAITALVLGIAQVVLLLTVVGNIVLAVPAIVFGSLALKQIRLRGERGRGMAIAGLVLGIIGVVIFVLIIILIAIGLSVQHGSGSGLGSG